MLGPLQHSLLSLHTEDCALYPAIDRDSLLQYTPSPEFLAHEYFPPQTKFTPMIPLPAHNIYQHPTSPLSRTELSTRDVHSHPDDSVPSSERPVGVAAAVNSKDKSLHMTNHPHCAFKSTSGSLRSQQEILGF
ncbi:unnamed protein product [Victoria cruziana]